MLRNRVKFFLLAVVLSILPLSAGAQEKAQMPWSMVSSYQELFKSLGHLDLIDPSIMILSTNREVPPQAITFRIKVADGWESFSPNENGVIEFP